MQRGLLVAAFLILLAGCAAKTDKLYGCDSVANCTLVRGDVVGNKCCAWMSINIKYEGWQESEAAKMRCPVDCGLQPPVTPACVEGQCVVQTIKP